MVKHNSSFLDVKLENTCLNCSKKKKKVLLEIFRPGGLLEDVPLDGVAFSQLD